MNYEQKYKNALERARDLMTNQNPPAFDKHLIEMVFPELKESEDKDEMIRQCLIEHIKCNKDLNWSLFQWFKPDTIIAWLEKQGEKLDAKLCQSEVTKTSDQELSDNIDVRTMAAWQSGYKEAIEKACEWLDCYIDNYLFIDAENKAGIRWDDFINDFKQATKGEQLWMQKI